MSTPSAPAFAGLWRDLARTYGRDGDLIGPVAAAFLFLPGLMIAVIFHVADVPLDSPGRLLAMLPAMVIAAVGQGLITRIALDSEGEGRPVFAALGEARRHTWRVLIVSSLTGLAVLFGTLAFILPGIWLMARFAPAVPLIFAERLSPSVAVGRAWELTRSESGALFGFFGVLSLFSLAALLLAALAGQALDATAVRFGVGPIGSFAGHALVQAVSAAVGAAMAIAHTTAYRHCKRAVLLATS